MGFCSKNLLIQMAVDEATDNECENLETIIGGVNIEDVIGKMDKIFSSDIKLTLEALNIHKCSRLDKYLIESDDLAKYMMDNSIHTFTEAIKNISEHYKVEKEKIAVVVDESVLKGVVEEAKVAAKSDNKAFKEAKLKELGGLQKAIEIMKEQGVILAVLSTEK